MVACVDATAAALVKSLNAQRDHVLGILDGLGDDELCRPVLPTGWSCAGLVHHLALDVERFWFQEVVAGTPLPMGTGEETASAWQVPPGMAAADVLSLYRREIDQANRIIDTTPLDAAPAWWPDFFGAFRLADLRAVLLHVITETACHAGHLDAARELIDGRTWLVL
jgi:uncharacterized damage-inducible protein DinB